MNYYEHHIGDYDSATAHLSLTEDGVYRRLICIYYRTEQALPSDVVKVCRLVRAISKQEREAVEQVLSEFFELRDDGWHNSRCDTDIDRYQKKAAHNREVGKLGGRPRKLETQKEPGNNHGGFSEEPERNPLQTPVTSNQKPETREKTKRVAALTVDALVADGLSLETAEAWLAHRRGKRAPLTPLAWAGFMAEVTKAPGWTVEAAVLKAIARNWTGFEASWVVESGSKHSSVAPVNRQEALEARNREVGRRWAESYKETIDEAR